MCILLWLLLTLVEWLSLFKEDNYFNCWITDSSPPELSWWTIDSNNWYQSIRSLKIKFNKLGRSMVNLFRKDSLKEKMKTHLLCMGLGYWILTKSKTKIIEEEKLEECSEDERDLFMCNMRER